MGSVSSDKSNSIVETSLTELAFIFFFILLVFSALKITELLDKEEQLNREKEVISVKLNKVNSIKEHLIKTTLPVRQALNNPIPIDPNDIFEGLEKDMKVAVSIIERQRRLDQGLLNNDIKPENIEIYIEAINQITKFIDKEKIKTNDAAEIVQTMIEKINTLTGQNANLRRRLGELGNGLDHPPCWADEQGNIQYVYSIKIKEDGMIVERAWPVNLQSRVDTMPYIEAAIGSYKNKLTFWRATNQLYQDSVKNECRHFVKIDDQAISKDAFKSYLLAIERYFYKLLL
jgi:hypothetical protein